MLSEQAVPEGKFTGQSALPARTGELTLSEAGLHLHHYT